MIWAWLIFGAILMLLELFLPGLITIFLGAGAWIVALLLALNLIDSWPIAIILWFIISTALTLGLRGFFTRLLPGETEESFETNEDIEAFGKVVEVVQEVRPNSKEGRIRYQGTTWAATCVESPIKVGAKATIVARENLLWVIEEFDESTDV
jgi:inner membrane protein